MLVQDLLRGCRWIWVPLAALCLLIQPGAVLRWARVALLSPSAWWVSPAPGPAGTWSGIRQRSQAGAWCLQWGRMLSEVKVVPQPTPCLHPGHPPHPAAARAIEERVPAWSQGFCPSTSGCFMWFVWDMRHHWGLSGCLVPSPWGCTAAKGAGDLPLARAEN